ncbi:hypothetical protein [Natrononativus amylolyticus]|uniref:hypothetical protein n=1 Tax=Natrononativus amylolyticus TaxID=2963434 RepID=UPI003CE48873
MQKPADVIAEAFRDLRPGGNLYLDVNCFSLPATVRKQLGWIDQLHPHHFSPTQMRSLISSAGFTIKQLEVTKASFEQSGKKFIAN